MKTAGVAGCLLCDAFSGNNNADLESIRQRFASEANVKLLPAGLVPGGFSKNGQPCSTYFERCVHELLA
jgi:hypothetical protein